MARCVIFEVLTRQAYYQLWLNKQQKKSQFKESSIIQIVSCVHLNFALLHVLHQHVQQAKKNCYIMFAITLQMKSLLLIQTQPHGCCQVAFCYNFLTIVRSMHALAIEVAQNPYLGSFLGPFLCIWLGPCIVFYFVYIRPISCFL